MQSQITQPEILPQFEEWCPIVGYEGIYSVSSLGRVRRDAARYPSTRPGGIMKLSLRGKNGRYLRVTLFRSSVKATFSVHRLVLLAFHGLPQPGQIGNHKDGCKTNNCADNLEWVTQTENRVHAIISGLQPVRRGTEQRQAKLSENDVINIRTSALSSRELAKSYPVTPRTIRAIRQGVQWKHLPFR